MALERILAVNTSGGNKQLTDSDTARVGRIGAESATGPASVVIEVSGGATATLSSSALTLSSGIDLVGSGVGEITGFANISVGSGKFTAAEIESTGGDLTLDSNNASDSTITMENAGAGGLLVDVMGDMSIAGDLDVQGTLTTINTTNLAVADAYIEHNAGYILSAAVPSGDVYTIDPDTSVQTTVDTGGFVAKVGATTDADVTVVSSASFTVGDIVAITGANDADNDGLFEIASIPDGTSLRMAGEIVATQEDFTKDDFTTDATVAGTITKVAVGVFQFSSSGVPQTAFGATTPLTFNNLATGGGNSLQQAYDVGVVIQLADADGDLVITLDDTGTAADFALTDSGGDYLRTDAANNSLDLGSSGAAVDIVGTSLVMTGNPTVNAGTGQWDFGGNVDANAGLDVSGSALTSSAGATFSSGEVLVSGGNLQLNDSVNLTIGTGDDLTIVHGGTNTTITSATGDLIIDNTNATGSTIIRLGTDTSATDFQVQGDGGTSRFTVTGASTTVTSHANFVTEQDTTIGSDGNDTLIVNAKLASATTLTVEADGAAGGLTINFDTQTGVGITGGAFTVVAGTGSGTDGAGGNIDLTTGSGGTNDGDAGNLLFDVASPVGSGGDGLIQIAHTVGEHVEIGWTVAGTAHMHVLYTAECSTSTDGGARFACGIGVAKSVCIGADLTVDNDTTLGSDGTDTFTLNANILAGNGLNWHNGANVLFGFDQALDTVTGDAFTITAGQGGTTSSTGGDLNGNGGLGGGPDGDGGNLNFNAGAASGSGTDGEANFGTSNTSNLNFGASTIDSDFLGGITVAEDAVFAAGIDITGAFSGTAGLLMTALDLGASGDAIGDIYGDGFLCLTESSIPTGVANKGILYTKDVAGETELCYVDSANQEVLITNAGFLNSGELNVTIDDVYTNGRTWTNDLGPWIGNGDGSTTGGFFDLNPNVPGETSYQFDLTWTAIVATFAVGAFNLVWSGLTSLTAATDAIMINGDGITNSGAGNSVFAKVSGFDIAFDIDDPSTFSDTLTIDGGGFNVTGGTVDIDVASDFSAGVVFSGGGNAGAKFNNDIGCTWGTGDDWVLKVVSASSDKLQLLPGVDDPTGIFEIGDGTTDTDFRVYLGAATDYWEFNVGGKVLMGDNVDLQVGDNDLIICGDGNDLIISSGGADSSVDINNGDLIFTLAGDGAGDLITIENNSGTDWFNWGGTGIFNVLTGAEIDGNSGSTLDWNGTYTFDGTGSFTAKATFTSAPEFASGIGPTFAAGDTSDIGALGFGATSVFAESTIISDISTDGSTTVAAGDAVELSGVLLGSPADAATSGVEAFLGIAVAAAAISSLIAIAVAGSVVSCQLGAAATIVAGECARPEDSGNGGVAGKMESCVTGATNLPGSTSKPVVRALNTQAVPGGTFLGLVLDRAGTLLS